jgi:hypothetical protein
MVKKYTAYIDIETFFEGYLDSLSMLNFESMNVKEKKEFCLKQYMPFEKFLTLDEFTELTIFRSYTAQIFIFYYAREKIQEQNVPNELKVSDMLLMKKFDDGLKNCIEKNNNIKKDQKLNRQKFVYAQMDLIEELLEEKKSFKTSIAMGLTNRLVCTRFKYMLDEKPPIKMKIIMETFKSDYENIKGLINEELLNAKIINSIENI